MHTTFYVTLQSCGHYWFNTTNYWSQRVFTSIEHFCYPKCWRQIYIMLLWDTFHTTSASAAAQFT